MAPHEPGRTEHRFAALRDARLVAGPPDARLADLLGEHQRPLAVPILAAEHGTRTSAVRLTAVGQDVLVEHVVVDERQGMIAEDEDLRARLREVAAPRPEPPRPPAPPLVGR